VRFGPVAAAVVAEEAAEPALNFILGAGAPGAVEDGYLPAAVRWMERHDVDFRISLTPGCPSKRRPNSGCASITTASSTGR